ncbi:MAG TPA: recombinase family protein, partial [bacterium]|nr:recombinase family protein [bacterium]
MRYLIYARKSSESDERQILSIPAQLREVREYAEKYKLEVVDEITEAKSARFPGKREGFKELLNRIKSNECNRILVWHTNRLSRNPLESGEIMQMLSDGVIEEIRTPTSSVTTENSNDILLGVEFGSHSQFSKDLSRNTKRGFREKILRGEYPTYAPPFYLNSGAVKGRKNIVPDERIRKYYPLLVDKVVSEKIRSDNAYKILQEWNVKSNRGRFYSRNTVNRLLRNPVYYGKMKTYQSNQLVAGTWVPLISEEKWSELQGVLDEKAKPYFSKHNHPYRKTIHCGKCGYYVVGYTKVKPSGKQYTYYGCSKRGGQCKNSNVTLTNLEEQLFEIINGVKLDLETREKVKEEVFSRLGSEMEVKKVNVKEIEKEITKLEEEKHILLQMRVDNEINSEEYIKEKQFKETKISELKELRGDSEYNLNDIYNQLELFIDKCFNLQELFINGTPEERTLLINEIAEDLILEDERIRWNYKIGYRSMVNQDFLSTSFKWGRLYDVIMNLDS